MWMIWKQRKEDCEHNPNTEGTWEKNLTNTTCFLSNLWKQFAFEIGPLDTETDSRQMQKKTNVETICALLHLYFSYCVSINLADITLAVMSALVKSSKSTVIDCKSPKLEAGYSNLFLIWAPIPQFLYAHTTLNEGRMFYEHQFPQMHFHLYRCLFLHVCVFSEYIYICVCVCVCET